MNLACADLLHARPERYLRRLPAREAFLWGTPGASEVVVKRMREAWALAARSGGEIEYDNLRRLAAQGLPVPRALGWSVQREGLLRLSRRSVVVMERIEHAETLRERLRHADAAGRRELGRRLLAIVVRLHDLGWYHRDLYLQHLLLRGEELVLIDVGRARCRAVPRRRWLVKDLAALLHSAPRAVPARERLQFLARYLDLRGVAGRTTRHSWLRAIVAHEKRMSAHTPRHGEDEPWTDR